MLYKRLFELEKIDWTLLLSNLVLNLIISLTYVFNLYDRQFITEFYFFIPLVYVFLIFDVFHKRFWNKKILLIWGVLGIAQLIVYYSFKDLPEFHAVNGNHLEWLKALPLTIFTSFILNLINKKVYGDYFIVTMMRFGPNEINPKDGRKLRPADYVFSITGFLIIIFGTVFTN